MYNQDPTRGVAGGNVPGGPNPPRTPIDQQNVKPESDEHKNPISMVPLLAVMFGIIAIIAVVGLGISYLKNVITKPTTTVSITTTVQSALNLINNCEIINTPGKYFLANNFKANISSGACINVTSDNVAVICDSNKITGSGPFEDVPPFSDGIAITGDRNVSVSGCKISNFSYALYSVSSYGLNIY